METAHFQDILSQYDLGDIHRFSRLKKGYANANFKVEAEAGNFVLRRYHHLDDEGVQYVIRLIAHLHEMQIPLPEPILNRKGKLINETKEGPVVLFHFVEGREPEKMPGTVAEIAKANARLSLLDSKKFERANPINLENCEAVLEKLDTAPFQFPELFDSYRKFMHLLRPILQEPLPSGLVHGDIFTDNTIFKNGKLKAIIDWEMASTDHLIFDAAMTINGFCYTENRLDEKLLQIFVDSYQQVRPFTLRERELLPRYIQWAAVSMASWHLENQLIFDGNEKQRIRVGELLERAEEIAANFNF